MNLPPGSRPDEGEIVGRDGSGTEIRRYSIEPPTVDTTGTVTSMALYAGQSAGLTRGEATAADIVNGMVSEAASVLARIAR